MEKDLSKWLSHKVKNIKRYFKQEANPNKTDCIVLSVHVILVSRGEWGEEKSKKKKKKVNGIKRHKLSVIK